ncbi:MAG: hypothetical protein AB1589_21360 [Cyanobacteriota bacterium]
MLQIVGIITLILLGAAALFAWLQNRPIPAQRSTETNVKSLKKLRVTYLC